MRGFAWFVVASMSIATAACGGSTQEAAKTLAAPDLVTEGGLERLLPSPADVNTAMRATGMTVVEPMNEMWDNTSEVLASECRYVDGPAEAPVYAGTGWTAVRGGALHQPGDFTHFAGLVVVQFPSSDQAAAFIATSAERWPACSNRQFTSSQPGQPDVVWAVGPVANSNGTLVVTKTRQDASAWSCERALTARKNVAIDVIACGASPAGSAVALAQQIAATIS